jgi:hypothetical protein
MARLTNRDDDADTAAEAAREIKRMRLTDEEREAIEECVKFAFPTAHPTAATLRSLLERMK